MNSNKKRKIDSNDLDDSSKRHKTAQAEPAVLTEIPQTSEPQANDEGSSDPPARKDATRKDKGKKKQDANGPASGDQQPRRRINKLDPPRPFPVVPTSVSDTGPRSSHREGKNMICLTRKTSLGAYMRRCKDVILKDGYKTLHLSAMGAAIPLLLQLVAALPPILPFTQDEIHSEITTGTVEVQDEVIPDDEEEDITYQTRGKSVLRVVFKIGDGEFEGDRGAIRKYSAGKSIPKTFSKFGQKAGNKDIKGKNRVIEGQPPPTIFEEPEQEMMDML
ncbi:hypothetical protein M413DRAFT_110341 [Hebeloma cylindrosporum]|uniref:Uncharacterized protein n=1 Tax=Hebeloma cylindrosporum TaxID=76867 RepID=A0A0C2Z8S2_HEBCY|nr:hypothetical protein M413DRAFT_110341 [Hebeloma cylindrosporum h7]